MKTKLTKVIAMMFVVLMVVTAMPVYAGNADSMNCDEAKASKILPEEGTKGMAYYSYYPEPPMDMELGTWIGYQSNYIRWLQDCLSAFGFDCKGIDGWYGNNTANAVRSFQKTYGLYVDGAFGPQTHAKLNDVVNGKASSFSGNGFTGNYLVTEYSGLKLRSYHSTSSSATGQYVPRNTYVYVYNTWRDSSQGAWGYVKRNGVWGWIRLYDPRGIWNAMIKAW